MFLRSQHYRKPGRRDINPIKALAVRCFVRLFGRPSSIVGVTLLGTFSLASLLIVYSLISQQQQEQDVKQTAVTYKVEKSHGAKAKKLPVISSSDKTPNKPKKSRKRTIKTTTTETAPTEASFFDRKVEKRYPIEKTEPPAAPSADCDVVHPPAAQKRYVVFSCRFGFYRNPEKDCLNINDYDSPCTCAFALPIAVAAWRRFDYEAVIFILTEPSETWRRRKSFQVIIDTLNAIDRVHMFLVPIEQPGNDERVLQKSIRLFAAKFLPLFDTNSTDPYIVTSEAYMHPSSTWATNIFDLDDKGKKDVLIVLPDGCCEQFYSENQLIRALPAASGLGMRASRWREIMEYVDEDDDIIREIRIRLHTVLGRMGGLGVADFYAVEKTFSALFHRWLERNPGPRVCRVEERRMVPSESRVFQLPIAVQSLKYWHAVRELVRTQTQASGVLDLDDYFHNYIESVTVEQEMDEPTPKPTRRTFNSVNSNLTTNYDARAAFLPLNLNPLAGNLKPYKGLKQNVNEEALKVPLPFNQVTITDPVLNRDRLKKSEQ